MGILKKHLGAYSVESSQLFYGNYPVGQNVYYIPCKATDGTTFDYTYTTQASSGDAWKFANTFSMRGFVPVATNDKLENYDVNDYQITPVGVTTASNSKQITNTYAKLIITATVTNLDGSDIEVSCIRFKKQRVVQASGTLKDVLVYSYYLDTPVVIEPNANKTFVIEFNVTVGE